MVELGVEALCGGSKGLTSLNRPRQGGGNLCGSVSHAASQPQTEGRDELEGETEREKDRERVWRGNGRDEKKQEGRKKQGAQRGQRAGPQSIKGCYGREMKEQDSKSWSEKKEKKKDPRLAHHLTGTVWWRQNRTAAGESRLLFFFLFLQVR